ncbi:hypothetical protein BV25DRAFT_421208 [Artomyces pyxidatus]|uniref:Uncharacterized protein n=1 Tax=Artomyces pyxidatus TaxID=48021 RepID=A0ACB8T4E8_9AGAM|nr:hypothetical protein BV25DRAFT_421208 [Artomyces pyxidatus]
MHPGACLVPILSPSASTYMRLDRGERRKPLPLLVSGLVVVKATPPPVVDVDAAVRSMSDVDPDNPERRDTCLNCHCSIAALPGCTPSLLNKCYRKLNEIRQDTSMYFWASCRVKTRNCAPG